MIRRPIRRSLFAPFGPARGALLTRGPLILVGLLLLAGAGCSRTPSREDSEKSAAQAPTPKPKADAAVVEKQPAGRPSATAEPQPTSSVQRISGAELTTRLSRSGAKGTLVNAWASWCGPCRREFPMLISMKDNLESQGLDIVFVSVDEPDSEGAAFDFASQNGLSGPVLVAERPLGPFKQALHPKWPGMLPATFLFDGTGKLRYFWGGPVYESELLPVVEGFLAGKDIDGQANFGLRRGKDHRAD